MLELTKADFLLVFSQCVPYLIGGAVVIVAAIAAMILFRKKAAAAKYLVRTQGVIAMILALVVVVNLILTGPLYSVITLVTDQEATATLSEETVANANAAVEEIMGEGIVLLKNDGLLPLSVDKVNVFGWASINPCYGGTGSGGLSDNYPFVSLLDGLKNAGLEYNTELVDFYTEYRAERPPAYRMNSDIDWTLPEPPVDTYSDELLQSADAFSDTALIVLTRIGGEGIDLPKDVGEIEARGTGEENQVIYVGESQELYYSNAEDAPDFQPGDHYLQLSRHERDMVEMVCGRYENVVIIYNSANTLELGFVEDYPQIKGVVWCPGAGQTGFNSLGKILTGEINPSGKTADVFAYDIRTNPSWNNLGNYVYDNMKEFEAEYLLIMGGDPKTFGPNVLPRFVNYTEGIYVGYKFYETAAAEGLIDYDAMVQYPFGYGLSYTTFTQEMGRLTESNGTISFDVTVKNTGDVAGKEVVEVYYNPPYINGGVEKSSANLITFAKTDLLQPGDSQTLTLSFAVEDMASFDTYGEGCYILDAGDYVISINSDSHHIIDSQVFTLDEKIVYDEDNKRSSDDVVATPQFEVSEGDLTYLSRADHFANYEIAIAPPSTYSMPDKYKAMFINSDNYDPTDYNDPNDVMPTQGVDSGMELYELRGADYDDPRWETLLNQMTVEDMDNLIALGGYMTSAIESIGKIRTTDVDGPSAIKNNFTKVASIGFASTIVTANTWNLDLALKFGEMMGLMADEMNVSGLYAPAMNIHRHPLCGRNFEYYSEDGVLSGLIGAQVTAGAKKYGVYSYLKHFVVNDQEIGRDLMICTWLSEQALREIYMKPFEISIKEGGATALMSALNYLGPVWVSGNYNLFENVVRGEWGFRGMVLTDGFRRVYYQDADIAVRNGTDLMLTNVDTYSNHMSDTESATAVIAMRKACHNILYTVVNSRAYEENPNAVTLEDWQVVLIAADVAIAVALLAVELLVVRKGYLNRKKAETNA